MELPQGVAIQSYAADQQSADGALPTAILPSTHADVPSHRDVTVYQGGRRGGRRGRGMNTGSERGVRGRRGRNGSHSDVRLPLEFDLNQEPLRLDLNELPEGDCEFFTSHAIPLLEGHVNMAAPVQERIQGHAPSFSRGVGRGRGRGRREDAMHAVPVHNCARGRGRPRGRPRGSRHAAGRGRGLPIREDSRSSNGSMSENAAGGVPVGWNAPDILPRERSPHVLRRRRSDAWPAPTGGLGGQRQLNNGNGDDGTLGRPDQYSPNSNMRHHRRMRRLSPNRLPAGGGTRAGGANRGLDEAFLSTQRVEEWLRRNGHVGDEGIEGQVDHTVLDDIIPRREGPWGYMHMSELPDAVHVPLGILGYDPAEWGGLAHFVGEPLLRWQEGGERFYFVLFRGSVGGRRVLVRDCRPIQSDFFNTRPGLEAGSSRPTDVQSLSHGIPHFLTQQLGDDGITSLRHSSTPSDSGSGSGDVGIRSEQPSRGADALEEDIPAAPDSPRTDSSSQSSWRAEYRDFAGNASSLDFSGDCSDTGTESSGEDITLLHELGCYGEDGDLDDLDFRARYHDRFWQSSETTLLGDLQTFRGALPGPKARVPRRRCAVIEFFDLFFDRAVVQRMVEQTNIYAEQHGTGRSQGTNGGPLWVPTCKSEMRAFIGVAILMGIKMMPTIRDYWKRNEFLHCTLIARVFTRNRFESLLRCIHLVDNRSIEGDQASPLYDKLAKVRWLLEDFVTKSRALYNPDRYITCDEIMVAYRGHYSGFRQYMPAKPTKYGFKYFSAVCNPSRYIYHLIPYVGASGAPEQNQGERVVRELTVGLDGVGHVVVCDNFFTAPRLFEDLYVRGILATGTVRENRIGLPTSILGHKKGDHPRGTLLWRMHAQRRMAATCWYDSKPVYFLSTSTDPVGEGARSMRWVDQTRQAVPTTPQQVEYQKHMRGVDIVDQMRTDYSVQFHSHKWWHKHLFFIVDSWLNNSWVLFKHDRLTRHEQVYRQRLTYHMEVAEALIAPWLAKPSTCRVNCLRHPAAIHYSSLHPRLRRFCIVCRRRTRF